MKKVLIFWLMFQTIHSQAQTSNEITLEECRKMAIQNFPNINNQEQYQQIFQLKNEQLQTQWYPQVSLNGQAMYQSDVFQLPFAPPGMEVVKLPHERVQGTLDINQSLFDGGLKKSKLVLEKEQLNLRLIELEVEKHQLINTVDAAYFSILLAQRSDSILISTLNLLLEKKKSVESARKGGIASDVDLLKLDTEILKVRQQLTENHNLLNQSKKTLELLIGDKVDSTNLKEPEPNLLSNEIIIKRPEKKVLSTRQDLLNTQQNLLHTKLNPKISLFASVGAGYPNPFNFYDINLSPFYTVGAKLVWNFWDWNSTSKESQALKIQSKILQNNKDNFDRSVIIKLNKLKLEAEKFNQLMEYDRKMIEAQKKVRELSSIRLDEGIISSSEYLEDVNAEKISLLNYEIHRIMWIKSGIDYLTESGTDFNE